MSQFRGFLGGASKVARGRYLFGVGVSRPLPLVAPEEVNATTSFSLFTGPEITFQRLISTNLSAWWPLENYSHLSHQNDFNATTPPRRCYSSRPVAVDDTPTTLAYGSLLCVCGNLTIEAKVVNDTTFCCIVNSGANATANSTPPQQQKLFVWPAPIEVHDANVLWFTDTAGIVLPITSAPTPMTPTPSGDVANSSTIAPTVTTSPAGGNDDSCSGDHSSLDNEDTAILLGVCMMGIGGIVVLVAVVYFKWWKPRQASGGSVGGQYHQNKSSNNRYEEVVENEDIEMLVEDVDAPLQLIVTL